MSASPQLQEVIRRLQAARAAGTAAAAEELALARALLLAGRPEEAEPLLARLTERGEGGADPPFLLGQIYARRGETDPAIAAWQTALDRDLRHRQALLALAAALAGLDRQDAAAAAYARGLCHHPADPFLYRRLAALAPDHPWLLVARGDAHALEGDAALALEYCQRAAELAPNDPEIAWRQAWYARQVGLADEALAAWDRAVRLRPGLVDDRVRSGLEIWMGGR